MTFPCFPMLLIILRCARFCLRKQVAGGTEPSAGLLQGSTVAALLSKDELFGDMNHRLPAVKTILFPAKSRLRRNLTQS
jgi:hypothetical protein